MSTLVAVVLAGAVFAADVPQGETVDSVRGTNVVRLSGSSFCDDAGPFFGLGVSYFQALRHAKYDRARLESNLAFLAKNGFNYVRVLSMVNWDGLEIAPVTFTNRAGHRVEAWPDYWQHFRDLLDLVARHGLRTEVTIFADAQYVMPTRSARMSHLDGILTNIRGREGQLLHLEMANEAWQNGFPGASGVADLRAFTQYLTERTEVLVAITSNDDTSDAGIISLYRGSTADLATVHFSRDLRSEEGGWLPVRDCFRAGRLAGVPPVSSNEPIGPGSSVNSETDPIKLCSAAVFAYLANLPAYVFHSSAGVYARESFEETPGIGALQFVRRILPGDLASWERNDGLESTAPFTVFCDGHPNRYWTEVSGATSGCHRNIGSSRDGAFVSFPMGILRDGVILETRRPLRVEVINPLMGVTVSNLTLGVSQRFTLPQGPGAFILKGNFLEAERDAVTDPPGPPHTRVSIRGDRWLINEEYTYPGSKAAGLLMNVRMVNAVFEDRNRSDFDPDSKTAEFVARLPDYVAHGIRAFTIGLQGGMPGYEGAVNSAFDPDGSLRPSYLRRVQRVIEACDRHGAAVILGCYYQRQDQVLRDEAAVRAGVVNVAAWIRDHGFANVLLEIANEFGHDGFDHPVLKTDEGVADLIALARRTAPGLLVSASGLGDGQLPDRVAQASDFLLIHFNGTSVEDIPARVLALRKFEKPIVCNEDEKVALEGAQAAELCSAHGASWGLMRLELNQHFPFTFLGAADDPAVYSAIRRITTDHRLRLLIETDVGGDPDDEQSLVRFLLYADEWEVEGIIANRPTTRRPENRNPADTGLGIVRRLLEAYGECQPNLARHDPRYPTKEYLWQRTVAGYNHTNAAVDFILAAVDRDDPRPLWYSDWGTDHGAATNNLRRALDRVLRERGPEGYARFKSKLRLSSHDQFGEHTTAIDPPFPIWVNTFEPELDGKRWYHRFSALTAQAGGFDLGRDVLTGHGPLGALYPTNTTHWLKEGDSMTFLYLVPTGMNDPDEPSWGSWAGRYGPYDRFPGKPYYWANAADDWNGTTHRENSLARWAVDLQNDFRARLAWCVRAPLEANHAPRIVLDDITNDDILHRTARPGQVVSLDASRSWDPDGDSLDWEWFIYREAGTYNGAVNLTNPSPSTALLQVPSDAAGKTIHAILAVRDRATLPLAAYRRVVVQVLD